MRKGAIAGKTQASRIHVPVPEPKETRRERRPSLTQHGRARRAQERATQMPVRPLRAASQSRIPSPWRRGSSNSTNLTRGTRHKTICRDNWAPLIQTPLSNVRCSPRSRRLHPARSHEVAATRHEDMPGTGRAVPPPSHPPRLRAVSPHGWRLRGAHPAWQRPRLAMALTSLTLLVPHGPY